MSKPLKVRYFRTKLGRWTWALYSGNRVNWASPSKGFFSLKNAQRSFRDMVTALGGDPTVVIEDIRPKEKS